MSEVQIRSRENSLIALLIKQLNNIYVRLIAIPLLELTRRKIVSFLNGQLPVVIGEMTLTIEDHFTQIFSLEFARDKELDITELRTFVTRFSSQSQFNEALANFELRIREKVLEISVLDIDNEQFSRLANDIGINELFAMKRIAVTESVNAINRARAIFFEQEDPLGEDRYKWKTVGDDRVSLQCRTIEARVNSAGGSMKLEELRRLVNSVATEINPDWAVRDWMAHINERSYLVKI